MRRDARRQGISVEEIADVLCRFDSASFEREEVIRKTKQMLVEGARWLFLESKFGKGVTFVLGTALSKTFWTKLTRKSGDRYDEIMETLKEKNIPGQAKAFAGLRDDVIRVKMQSLGLDLPVDLLPAEQPASTSMMALPQSLNSDIPWSYSYDSQLSASVSVLAYQYDGEDQYGFDTGFDNLIAHDFPISTPGSTMAAGWDGMSVTADFNE